MYLFNVYIISSLCPTQILVVLHIITQILVVLHIIMLQWNGTEYHELCVLTFVLTVSGNTAAVNRQMECVAMYRMLWAEGWGMS